MSESLDIVIPVYNEGGNIVRVLDHLSDQVHTPFRILIGYDRDDDDTLPALAGYPSEKVKIVLVKNRGRGVIGAIKTCFEESRTPAALVFPADDVFNGGIIDRMVDGFMEGCDIVAASRFMKGGRMTGCPPIKAVLVRSAAWILFHVAGLPTHDPTNGFRLFSRRVIRQIPIESDRGFAFSLELLVKAHRRRWKIGEVPSVWIERDTGQSRFRVFRWLPVYLKWFFLALCPRPRSWVSDGDSA
ncbi:MAG: glycosyltransferase family 2 protein [Candidatus Omnitrophica bacterium]|nr:glycosyltransferase family 2 protein [Candidatus Omnitrophota bacterium]